jgi:hypothetical protein
MPDPLPGMPRRYGDAGLFVCGPEDVAPWESVRPVRKPVRAGAPLEQVRAPRRALAWLVLTLCPLCNPRTGGYCHEHDRTNWWLENMRVGGRRNDREKEKRR